MSCVSDDTILALADGSIDERAREAALAHVDACDLCRELVADVLRDHEPPQGETGTSQHRLVVLPRPGDTIGRYVLLEWIASGGMGMVFSAYDPELDRRVAVKLIAPRAEEPIAEELRERLNREARAMARIRHEHVVRVYDVGRVQGSVYLVMEFVDGETLAAAATKTRSWEETLALYLQAGRGLAEAHRVDVVHRDFKPANVLVDRRGHARVADFGLAALVAQAERRESARWIVPEVSVGSFASRAGRIVGTEAFMAPEQARGEATHQSDQFSFCVALDRALARHGDAAPASVRQVVRRGMAALPVDRYPTMNDLLRAITASTARHGLMSRARRIQVIVLALAALFVTLPVVLGATKDGATWLSPRRLTVTAVVEAAAFVLVARLRRDLWSDRVFGPILRISAAVFAVEMVVALGMSATLRTSIVPLWLLLHAFAAAVAAIVVDSSIAVSAAAVCGLFVASCAFPSAQAALLLASAVVIAAGIAVLVRRRAQRQAAGASSE